MRKNAHKANGGQTDRQTDRPTDRPTDEVTYRVACTRLKITFNKTLNDSPLTVNDFKLN